MENQSKVIPLISGAAAGLSVDLALYPIDTVKTRLQSSKGFLASGGFRGVYSGLSAVAVGSAPGAAIFFLTYESVKKLPDLGNYPTLCHVLAASAGETTGCLVRVPCEVIKQRAQANSHTRPIEILRNTLKEEKIRGLYRGYWSTLVREIPFSMIQFPLWEYFRSLFLKGGSGKEELSGLESGVCGFLAGGISAAVTTPLDVAKTRIMLAESGSDLATGQLSNALKIVYGESGLRGLFAGAVPRTTMISLGGAIFLGSYDQLRNLLSKHI